MICLGPGKFKQTIKSVVTLWFLFLQYCQVLDQRLGSHIELCNSLPELRCVGGKIIRPKPRSDWQAFVKLMAVLRLFLSQDSDWIVGFFYICEKCD